MTEPEQPETVKVDEQLSALVSKIYGARPFGGMGVAEEALYNGMGEDGMSRGLFWYLGTDDIKFEAGVASESMITSQAHSIVVLRFVAYSFFISSNSLIITFAIDLYLFRMISLPFFRLTP